MTVLPALLDLLSIAGETVTRDALHTHRSPAVATMAQTGHDVRALKGHQGTLNADVRLDMEEPPPVARMTISDAVMETGHGRIETCRVWVAADIDGVQERHEWIGLAACGAVQTERYITGKNTSATRYCWLSETLSPDPLWTRVRVHWGIESALHGVLDVTMSEGQHRPRTGHGAANMSLMRRMAVNMARVVPEKDKSSMRSTLKRAGWNNNYRLEIIIGGQSTTE